MIGVRWDVCSDLKHNRTLDEMSRNKTLRYRKRLQDESSMLGYTLTHFLSHDRIDGSFIHRSQEIRVTPDKQVSQNFSYLSERIHVIYS